MASPLENAVNFLREFGFFDVILPFLLIFVVVYAILEKTKIFGKDPSGTGNQRVNSTVAFVIALFFVAVPSVVQSIQVSLPQIALLLLVIITFMMFLGALASGNEPFDLFANSIWGKKFWLAFIYIIIFVAVSAIFLNSFGWLDPVLGYIASQWQGTFLVSLIFLLIIVGTVYYAVGSGGKDKE